MEPEIWTGCYEGNWNGLITPESFAHLAKFAKGLIERIFLHMLKEGWLQRRRTANAIHCQSCGLVVELNHHDYNMQALSQTVQNGYEAQEILRAEVLAEDGNKEGKDLSGRVGNTAAGVRAMPEGIQATEPGNSVLLPTMRKQMDGKEQEKLPRENENDEGICIDSGSRPPQSKRPVLHHGASTGDGEEAGSISEKERSRSSQKQTEGRQPDRQFRIDDEARPRPPAKERTSDSSLLPVLPSEAADVATCPHCGCSAQIEQREFPPDTIADPFGGIASGGIVAAGLGLAWYGCELEEKFWHLGLSNIELHRRTWEQFGDPIPVLVNGDSRQLRKHLQGPIAAVVSSPPFCESDGRKGGSDLYLQQRIQTGRNPNSASAGGFGTDPYGTSPGQLGSMRPGSVDSVVEAVVSSPPYAESLRGDNSEQETASESREKRITPGGSLGQSCRHSGYGGPGNLGNLEAGEVDAVVTSPPYWETGVANANGGQQIDPKQLAESLRRKARGEKGVDLRKLPGETFWHAARDIVQECFAILNPGGYAAFVVKAFVRNKAIVDFPGDWRKLCEACGFVLVKEVRAMLTTEERHPDLFGGEDHVKTTSRMSFFRRLHVKKYPHLAINYEVVQFFKKP